MAWEGCKIGKQGFKGKLCCCVFRNRRNISDSFLVVKVNVSGLPTSQSDSDRRSNVAKRDISTAVTERWT